MQLPKSWQNWSGHHSHHEDGLIINGPTLCMADVCQVGGTSHRHDAANCRLIDRWRGRIRKEAEAVASFLSWFFEDVARWLKEETASEKVILIGFYGCWKNHDWSSFGWRNQSVDFGDLIVAEIGMTIQDFSINTVRKPFAKSKRIF